MTVRAITPGVACRLEFIVEDADGLAVPSMTHADVSSAAYRNVSAAGLATSNTTVTLTSSAAYTAAVSSGQFVTIDSARGHYAIDCPSGAASSSAGYSQAVVAFTAGHTVTALLHLIDATLAKLIGIESTSLQFQGVDGNVGEVIRGWLGMAMPNLDATITSRASQTSVDAIASAGNGARTVTITVNDGATVLQNAIVRMTEGANSFRVLTNVSGVAVFNLDDATYTVSITKAGYTYAGTTIVVNGTEAATYSMSVVAVAAPASPSKTAIEVLCLDEDDDPQAGIDIDMRRVAIPAAGTNTAYLGTKVTVTSNVSGIARFEVAQGITVEYKRGTADVWTRLVVDADSVTNVTSFIGSP